MKKSILLVVVKDSCCAANNVLVTFFVSCYRNFLKMIGRKLAERTSLRHCPDRKVLLGFPGNRHRSIDRGDRISLSLGEFVLCRTQLKELWHDNLRIVLPVLLKMDKWLESSGRRLTWTRCQRIESEIGDRKTLLRCWVSIAGLNSAGSQMKDPYCSRNFKRHVIQWVLLFNHLHCTALHFPAKVVFFVQLHLSKVSSMLARWPAQWTIA